MIVDLGTGDGRSVLTAAASEPGSLVVGIDAVAASMAEASRRAARTPRKGGLPNAVFLAAAAETLDGALCAAADLVTITFPWGSLLRGALGVDVAVADAITRLVKPGGRVSMLVSVTPRDGVEGVPCLDERTVASVAERHACRGLRLVEAHLASPAEVAATRSSWARRLGAGVERQAWRLEFERDG